MPWILCGPGCAAERIGDSCGSTATTCTPGFRFFRYAPTPVIVPPVPTPATKMSTSPSVSSQISGPVVAVDRGIGGFSNCFASNAPGVDAASSSGFSIAPGMPAGAGGEHQLGS